MNNTRKASADSETRAYTSDQIDSIQGHYVCSEPLSMVSKDVYCVYPSE